MDKQGGPRYRPVQLCNPHGLARPHGCFGDCLGRTLLADVFDLKNGFRFNLDFIIADKGTGFDQGIRRQNLGEEAAMGTRDGLPL